MRQSVAEWFRGKSTRVLAAAEFIFVILVILMAVRWRQTDDSTVYSLDYSALDAGRGVPMETFPYSAFSGIYLDNSLMDDGEKELTVRTQPLVLMPGVYRVDVVYSTGDSGNFLSVQSEKRWLSTADKAYISLPVGEDRTESVLLRSFFSMDDLSITVHYPGNGYIFVSRVMVTRIPGFPWSFLLCGIELFAILHLLSFLWRRYGKCGGEKREILIFLLGLSFVVSLPIFSVYLGTGDDLEYHLLRIDALAAGLRNGQFPVRVSSYWNNGYGYGSSLYYCDFFLLFPALLRIGGLSVQNAYKQYLFAINVLTAALSWYSFRKIASRKNAALGTILYTFLPYRILCLYRRAAVGEYTAMAFLPLAATGIYQIYAKALPQMGIALRRNTSIGRIAGENKNAGGGNTAGAEINEENSGKAGDNGKAENNSNFRKDGIIALRGEIRVLLPAVLGFSGLILSHVITTFLTVIATVILLLILIRRTVQPSILKRLAGAAILTFALCAWFVIPFADSMKNDIGTMHETEQTAAIEKYGTYLSQIADLFPSASGGNISTEDEPAARQNGTSDIVYSAGAAMYGTVLWILYRLIRKKDEQGIETGEENEAAKDPTRVAARTLGDISAGAGLICAFMSTVWFPWNSIAAAAPVLNQIVRNIQFPWRMLSIAGVFMVIASVELAEELRGTVTAGRVLVASLAGAALLSGLFLLHDYTVSTNVRDYSGIPAVDTTGIAGAEYLPAGADTSMFATQEPVPGEGVTIEAAARDGGTYRVTIRSADDGNDISESSCYIDVPFLYYPGYIGRDAETNQKFIAVSGSGGRVRIELPAGYQGTLEVCYSEGTLWRISELLSALTVIVLMVILHGRVSRGTSHRADDLVP